MEMKDTLKVDPDKPKKTWGGRYKGITYQITKWHFNLERLEWMWNYYITLNPKRITNEEQREKILLERSESSFTDKRYYSAGDISFDTDIKFHGECTYYERLGSPKPDIKMVRIGCDYGHHKDIKPYLNRVLSDVQITIDSFYDWIDIYLRRCRGCGTYFKPGTGIENERGWETKCGGEDEFCN